MKSTPIRLWYDRTPWAWVAFATSAAGFASILICLVVWLVDDEPEQTWLLALPAGPVLAWMVAYRAARADWPNQPARTIAATVTGCIVAAATLFLAVITDGIF